MTDTAAPGVNCTRCGAVMLDLYRCPNCVPTTAAPMFRREAVELVLRKHLPVQMGDDVICICDARLIFEGPVGQRLHVADELRKAGLIRD